MMMMTLMILQFLSGVIMCVTTVLKMSVIDTPLLLTNTRLGDRSFSVAGPRIWNGIPAWLLQPDVEFAHFKRLLKAFLFGETAAH